MVYQWHYNRAEMSVEGINDTRVCREDSGGLVVHNSVLVDVSYTKEVW